MSSSPRVSRRVLVKSSLGVGALAAHSVGFGQAFASAPATNSRGSAADASELVTGKDERLIVLKENPAVFETPLSLINQSQITPSELLFVRNNQQPKEMATLAPVVHDDWLLQIHDKSITVRQLKAPTAEQC